jgi:hypothetical protein
MTDVHNKEWDLSLTKEKTVMDVSYQSKLSSFYGLRYGASAMLNGQGTFMVGPGIGKTRPKHDAFHLPFLCDHQGG